MQSSPGAVACPRARLRPSRLALGLVVVIVAAGLRVGSGIRPGWAEGLPGGPPPGEAWPAGALTLTPTADATVTESAPDRNHGTDKRLKADGSPREAAYLRFPVAPHTTGRAILRLWVLDGTKRGPDVRRVDEPFDEATVTWLTQPTLLSSEVVPGAALVTSTWAEYDVTELVTDRAEDGVALALLGVGTDGVDFSSREGSQPPQLVIIPPVEATFSPSADARVEEKSPTANYGTAGGVAVDSGRGESISGFLRFTVDGIAGPVLRATLRVFVTDGTADGPVIDRTAGDWSETDVTWATRPAAAGTPLLDLGRVEKGWAELDLTGAIAGNGDLDLALTATSSDALWFRSKEWSVEAERPQLVVVSLPALPGFPGGGATPTTTATTSTTPTTGSTTTTTEPVVVPNLPTSSSTTSSTTTSTSTTTTSTTTTTTSTTTTTTTTPPAATTTTSSTTTTRPAGARCLPHWDEAERAGKLAHGLGEMSGLVASPRYPDWAWGIRDSGNQPSLFAIRPGGETPDVIEVPTRGLRNSDWEDIAWTPGFGNGPGHLWVLENVGNGHSGPRRIYQFEEPDLTPPSGLGGLLDLIGGLLTGRDLEAELVGSYQWAYPDEQVNTETMFVFDGDLVVVSKTSPSRVYKFDGPLQPFTVNVPRYVGTLPAGNNLSFASLSTDRRTLAVGSHKKIYVYENRGDPDDLADLIADKPVHSQSLPDDNREGGTFFPHGGCDLVLVAESKTLWKLPHR